MQATKYVHFNFETLKSLGRRVFFHHIGGRASPYGWDSVNGRQGGWGHNSGQNNYHTITSFQEKVTFMVVIEKIQKKNMEKIVFIFT